MMPEVAAGRPWLTEGPDREVLRFELAADGAARRVERCPAI